MRFLTVRTCASACRSGSISSAHNESAMAGVPVADGAAEEVGQRVGRVGRDEQAPPAAGGGGEPEGGRRRRLADAALAADEEEGAVQDVIEQGGAPA